MIEESVLNLNRNDMLLSPNPVCTVVAVIQASCWSLSASNLSRMKQKECVRSPD